MSLRTHKHQGAQESIETMSLKFEDPWTPGLSNSGAPETYLLPSTPLPSPPFVRGGVGWGGVGAVGTNISSIFGVKMGAHFRNNIANLSWEPTANLGKHYREPPLGINYPQLTKLSVNAGIIICLMHLRQTLSRAWAHFLHLNAGFQSFS